MLSHVHEQLPALFTLAHDRSEAGRLHLASKLADLFLTDGMTLNGREEQMLNELIELLLQSNDPTVRKELMQRFADAARMPRKLALGLAHEPIATARAVLLTNEALADDDLISIIATQSRDHASVIAARRAVSEAVADALVTTGDLTVMQTVAENLGARLSSKALTILAEAAQLTESLRQPVLYRPELRTDIAVKLYWWLATDLRRYALERFDMSPGRMDEELGKAIDYKLNEQIFARYDDAAMQVIAAWLEERNAINAKILPQILRLGHFRLFNLLLARLSRLGLPSIDIIVGEAGGRMLAAICRALNIQKTSFVSIFLLSRGARPDEQIVHPRELSHALNAFDRLTAESAAAMLHSWREHPDYLLHRYDTQIALGA